MFTRWPCTIQISSRSPPLLESAKWDCLVDVCHDVGSRVDLHETMSKMHVTLLIYETRLLLSSYVMHGHVLVDRRVSGQKKQMWQAFSVIWDHLSLMKLHMWWVFIHHSD
eukprot:2364323-Amphidinium_carterae.1